jgi:hypothetical protein
MARRRGLKLSSQWPTHSSFISKIICFSVIVLQVCAQYRVLQNTALLRISLCYFRAFWSDTLPQRFSIRSCRFDDQFSEQIIRLSISIVFWTCQDQSLSGLFQSWSCPVLVFFQSWDWTFKH